MHTPIRYTGEVAGYQDPISGLSWQPRQIQEVPNGVALTLLGLEFEDARHWKQKGRPIIGNPVPLPVEGEPKTISQAKVIEGTKRVFEEEEDNAPPLVHLDAMTKESITMYVHRNFGVELSDKMPKSEMIEKARHFMGGAPRHY